MNIEATRISSLYLIKLTIEFILVVQERKFNHATYYYFTHLHYENLFSQIYLCSMQFRALQLHFKRHTTISVIYIK